ncbi:SigB/SigF/SigG family RNA polymerase sigma factor [Streptomyces sp. NPDC005438]|uniref:SigB/SigF/SigG family RNA polymerase sigma factor n=1 Tax=Streptomyces sp. NPDC005438 TaxID=3156880 RepID=UPI0033ABBE0C
MEDVVSSIVPTSPAPSTQIGETEGTPLPEAPGPLPAVPEPRAVSPADARDLTRVFLRRLNELEEGTPEYQYVRNTLIELGLSVVNYATRRFRQREDLHEDLVQVGTIGLIKAIDRFDVDREVEFTSFAIPYITGEIKRFFRDNTWAVHVPRKLQDQRIALARANERLETELGRAPTTAELAEDLELSEQEVGEARIAANGYSARSIDVPVSREGGDRGEETLGEHLGFSDPALEKVENVHALKTLLGELDERERRIIDLHYGQELTQQQIGNELGISQMHVSRLLRKCLDRLRVAMTQA